MTEQEKKYTCDESSCKTARNILCDAYEVLAKALDEISEMETDIIEYDAQGHHKFRQCLQIAGNARRKAQYLIYDRVKATN